MARVIFSVLMATVSAIVVGAAWEVLPVSTSGLQPEVVTRLGESGVSNPVTAVLLNFRSYDTLLEVAVLMAAAVAVLSLHPHQIAVSPNVALQEGNEVLGGFVRLLAPLAVIVTGYLLWIGAYAPGGSFQAGAVLGAMGILVTLAGIRLPRPARIPAERILLVTGLAVFMAVAVAATIAGGALLEYPVPHASALILLIEAAVVMSVAMTMIVLFSGALSEEG